MIEEKLENVEDTKNEMLDLIGKLKDATTINEIMNYSEELKNCSKKLVSLKEKEMVEREEKIAGLTATLMQTYHYLDSYSNKIPDEKLPKTLNNLIEKHLEMAKEFDYLPTIKVLARELEFYQKLGIDEGEKKMNENTTKYSLKELVKENVNSLKEFESALNNILIEKYGSLNNYIILNWSLGSSPDENNKKHYNELKEKFNKQYGFTEKLFDVVSEGYFLEGTVETSEEELKELNREFRKQPAKFKSRVFDLNGFEFALIQIFREKGGPSYTSWRPRNLEEFYTALERFRKEEGGPRSWTPLDWVPEEDRDSYISKLKEEFCEQGMGTEKFFDIAMKGYVAKTLVDFVEAALKDPKYRK